MALFGWLAKASIALMVALVIALGVVKLRYGGGQPYLGVATEALHPASALEPLVTLDYPLGNVAVSADGRVFFNTHPFAQAHRFGASTVHEFVGGKPVPYPDATFQKRYQGVFGMTVDRQGRLWFIEPAGLDHPTTKLTAFDLRTNAPVFEYAFPAGEAKFAQDLRVTPDGATVILADTGLFKFTTPSPIAFDIAKKSFHKRLATHPSTQARDWVTRTPFGQHKLGFGLVTFAVGVDGIEISSDGQWLYYAAMNHDRLYRVPLQALRDATVDDAALAKLIEDLGPKPLSDGITIDAAGRVILTDIENGGLVRRDVDGKLTTLVKSPKVIWADGVVYAPDGALLFTDSSIPAYIDQLARPPSRETLAAGRPYHLYRLRP